MLKPLGALYRTFLKRFLTRCVRHMKPYLWGVAITERQMFMQIKSLSILMQHLSLSAFGKGRMQAKFSIIFRIRICLVTNVHWAAEIFRVVSKPIITFIPIRKMLKVLNLNPAFPWTSTLLQA